MCNRNCKSKWMFCMQMSSSSLALQPLVSFGVFNNLPPLLSVLCECPPVTHTHAFHVVLHCVTPSSSWSSLGRVSHSFCLSIIRGSLSSSILATCPIHLSHCDFINLTILPCWIISSNSWLYLIRHDPSGFFRGPKTFRRTFLSKAISLLCSLIPRLQVSAP